MKMRHPFYKLIPPQIYLHTRRWPGKQLLTLVLLLSAFIPANALAAPGDTLIPIVSLLLAEETQPATPRILMDAVQVGKNLQTGKTIRLSSTPENPVDVSLSLASDTTVTMSTDPETAGSSTINFTGITGTEIGTVYFQGIETGQANLLVQASGYDDLNVALEVVPSTLYVETPSLTGNQVENTFNANGVLPATIRSAAVDTGSGNILEIQPIRAGQYAVFNFASSNTGVGTATNESKNRYSIDTRMFMPGGADSVGAYFWPLSSGTTDISIIQPQGFTDAAGISPTQATVNTVATPGNTARFVFGCELNAGVIGTLLLDIELIESGGITWGPGPNPDITGVIGTGTYDVNLTGMLISFYDNNNEYWTDDDIHYGINGGNLETAEFYTMNGSYTTFYVQWKTCTDVGANVPGCDADMVMVINPWGPQTTYHQCQVYNASYL